MDMTNITPVNEDKKEQINNENGREKEIEIEKSKFLDRNLKKFFVYLSFFYFILFSAKSNVKLISSDGQIFQLNYECVLQSGTIKSLLESSPSNSLCV